MHSTDAATWIVNATDQRRHNRVQPYVRLGSAELATVFHYKFFLYNKISTKF